MRNWPPTYNPIYVLCVLSHLNSSKVDFVLANSDKKLGLGYVEEMLIHHFDAETQGFQMTEGKPKSLKIPIIWKKHFFRGFRIFQNEGQEYPNAYH